MVSSEGILPFFDNKTILVTGAAGFLAKVLVEKILRVQPNVRKMYLLLRASNNDSAKKRLETEVVGTELFKVAREKFGKDFDSIISEKLVVVPGDISCHNLGIEDSNLIREMWKDIDVIVNSAATTDFYERYDVSLAINTMGVVNVLEFAKKCSKLKVLLHVSTAYVCGEGKDLILEKEFHMGEALKSTQTKLNFIVEKRVVAEKLNKLRAQGVPEAEIATLMRDFGIQRAKEFGWPNTYVFTKAMGEMCLGEYKDNLPTVIIRPTMITSTYKEPFSGWIEGLRTLDSVVVNYGKGKISCFLAQPNLIMDMIPADMVINAMVVAMVVHANDESSNPFVYHVGSSLRNPMTFSNIHMFTYRYFTDSPLLDKHGKPITISKCYVLSSMTAFRAYVAIRFLLPLKILQVLNTVMLGCFQDVYNKSNRKFKLVMRLVDLYLPYLKFKGVFDDINSERLRQKAKGMYKMEADLFNFDPICIDWKEYIMNSHLPGLKKYVIK